MCDPWHQSTEWGRRHIKLSDPFVFRIADEKAIIVAVIDSMTDVDLAPAELKATNFVQFAAIFDTFILGHVFVFTTAAGGGNHVSPRLLMVYNYY